MYCRKKKKVYICITFSNGNSHEKGVLKRQKMKNGGVVQLVRMPACHAGGREFESRRHRQKSSFYSCFFLCSKACVDSKIFGSIKTPSRPTLQPESTTPYRALPSGNGRYKIFCFLLFLQVFLYKEFRLRFFRLPAPNR